MLRQGFLAGQIGKPGHLGLESEFDRSRRAVPLLADDDFGLAMHLFHVRLPTDEFLASLARLSAFQIIFLAENKKDYVGILLDRARFAQIGQLRPLVVAAFYLPRQ